jgi:hypothetical protein
MVGSTLPRGDGGHPNKWLVMMAKAKGIKDVQGAIGRMRWVPSDMGLASHEQGADGHRPSSQLLKANTVIWITPRGAWNGGQK